MQKLYPLELFCDRPQLQEPPRAPVGSLRIDDFRTTPLLGHVIVLRCRPVEIEFTIGSKDDNVGARGRQIFPPFLKFVFFFSQVSLFVLPECLNS